MLVGRDVARSGDEAVPREENPPSLRRQLPEPGDATRAGRGEPPVWFSLEREADPVASDFVSSVASVGFSTPVGQSPDAKPLPPPVTTVDTTNGLYFIDQAFYPDRLFPDGFTCRLQLCVGKDWGRVHPVKAGPKRAMLNFFGWSRDVSGSAVVKVTTTRDVQKGAKWPAYEKPAPFKSYAARAKESAAAYWAKSAVSFPGDPSLEDLWYATYHARRCVLRGGTVPPGLYLPSTINDYSWWHGDYHANYNMEAIYWGAMTANQMQQQAAYFDCVDFYRPIGEKIAKEYYGGRGCFIQLEGFPVRGDDDHNGNLPLGRMAYMTGWFPEPYFEWYKMTLDREWLAQRGYPFIKDAALFYLDFLKKAPNENLPPNLKDGRYHLFPSIQGESGFSGNPMDVCDKPQALMHCRHSLWMAIEASKELGVDEDLRTQWQERLDNLVGTYAKKGFKDPYAYHCYMANEPEHGGRVWAPPAKWDGQPRKKGRNESWYQGILTMSRIGMMRDNSCIPERDFPYLHEAMEKWCHENGLVWAMAISCYGRAGAWTETLSVMAPFQEMLLQSWDGSIRLFPRWPKDRDVAFSGWRAQGAFLVSGEQKSGKVSAKVMSEKGADCLVVGDWSVTDADGKSVPTDRDEFGRLRFKTAAGGTYSLSRK